MAQGTATPRPNSVKPVTLPSDSGITPGPLKEQAGQGGPSRSQANTTSTGNTSNGATVVFAVVDNKAAQQGLTLDADQLSGSDHRSEEDDDADTVALLNAPHSTAPKPVPRSGAGHSNISSETSTGSRMERSTASTSQERKSRKRSASEASTPAPTTMNSKPATTTTTTTNTIITTTTGIAQSARSPADLKRDPTEKAARAAAKVELQDPKEILLRVQIQNELIAAIDARDGTKVLSILESLPQPLHLLKYFPPPPVLRSYEKAQKWVYPFAEQQGLPELRYHITRAKFVATTYTEVTTRIQSDVDMRKLYPVEIQNVCQALLACPETEVMTQAKALETAIKQVMRSPHRKHLAELLAEQPFASTKLLNFRCTLLEQHTQGKTVREFHRLVQQAHTLRSNAGETLAHVLLNEGRNSPAVPTLVRMVYALMVTESPADYLLLSVSWDQAKKLQKHIHAMHRKATAVSAAVQGETWEATMLGRLKWRADTTMKKQPKTTNAD